MRPLRYGFISLLSTIVIPLSGQSLMINELMQSNVDVVWDSVTYEFPDSWVELYNNSPIPVSLSDYKIGTKIDKKNRPVGAWQLPADVVVPAYGHQLVYCDKEGERLHDKLHTNFRLESGRGCVVYLFKNDVLQPSASVMDSLAKQPAPNIAYGREYDGSSRWGYALRPSPGKANGGGICAHDRLLGSPVFSVSGFVKTDSKPVRLKLSLPKGSPKGTRIYYTMTGKEPTENDSLYTSPITISQSAVVRARLFCEGWLSPVSTTHSYIFLDHDFTLPVISISTNESYLEDPAFGIFSIHDNFSDTLRVRKNWRRPINLEYFEGENTKSILNQLCETRVGGNATREKAKKSLIVYAHKRFGRKLFDHEFFPDQKPGLHAFKSLILRNAGNDFDFLYMRDALAQRSMAMHVDLDWQAWQPAIVFINGEYYAMLNIRERAEEDNIYTNYSGLEDIDLFENWDNLREGDGDNLNRFTAFYHEDGHTMAEYERWMDCREFMNVMILNLYYCNVDFPGNNNVMWRPRTEGGRWRWIVKDIDYSIGIFDIPNVYEILKWLYDPEFDQLWRWNANGYPYTLLFRQLMKDQDFRNEFVERCAIYTGDFLNYDGFHRLLESMYQKISYELSFYGPLIGKVPAAYNSDKIYVDMWVKSRTNAFMQQLCEFYQLEPAAALTINTVSPENQITRLTFNDHQLSKARFNGRYFKNHPIRLTAQGVKGKMVKGWRVQCITRTTVSTEEFLGPTLTLSMPECNRLIIEPFFK